MVEVLRLLVILVSTLLKTPECDVLISMRLILITCFANDYGFEHWVEKAIDFYGDEGDLLIVISSSGRSQNMLNGVKGRSQW